MIPIVRLVGPGGAGKTTVGRHLAGRLEWEFLDLDHAFMAEHGEISVFIDAQGYDAYARVNVALHARLSRSLRLPAVMALSSGFMTYPDSIHARYAELWRQIELNPLTAFADPFLGFRNLHADHCAEATGEALLAG